MEASYSESYLQDEQLYEAAAGLARRLRPERERGGRFFLPALRRQLEEIRRCRDAIERRWRGKNRMPAACEWLLDNWVLARREALCAVEALRRSEHLRLSGGDALILTLARELLRAGDGRFSPERCRLFLDGFQSVTVLRRAELQLLPAALRMAAIRELAGLCRELPYAEDLSARAAAMEAVFTTLRLLSVLDMEALLIAADVTDAILSADPTGDYARMDRETRQTYLRRVEKLARREGMEEPVYARRLIKAAKAEGCHVGRLLFPEPSPWPGRLYPVGILLLSLGLSLWGGLWLNSLPAAALLLLPVSELVKSLLDFLLSRLVPARRLPRMDVEQGVPAEGRTLCVLSALLCSAADAEALAARLEELRLVCRAEGENLRFGLLADLPPGPAETLPEDAAVLRAAQCAVSRLNRKYRGGFYLFTRPRRFDGEQWSAPGRKRGALTELARLLDDEPSALSVEGDRDALAGTRYVLTLDSDTRLYPGAAGALIGAMLHPLCRARIDEERRVVTAGHGILQPRLGTDLESANATDFALIFSGGGGSDPYGSLCSALSMDAFGSTGFAGKGIFDVRAYLRCTAGRVREDRVLSHDALEGAFLRGGTLGDTEFSDLFPTRPLSYYKRLHRWVRGDWQNLPYLFCRELSGLDRWRLLDSLRRSLLPPMTLAAILAGFFLPGRGLALSAWAALLALLSRLFLALAEGGLRRRSGPRLRRRTRLMTGVGGAIVQSFLRLWLLPGEAWVCLSAAVLALWRLGVSHRRLLQWQTAAQSEQNAGGLAAHLRFFWQSILLGVLLLGFCPLILGKSAGLLWLLSPLTAAALALPARRESALSAPDRAYLRSAAEKQLRYYLELAGPADNDLPPDNFQEQPPVGAAHRTSPTNIGLYLASLTAAADLGLLSPAEAAARIGRTLSTLERIPRHLGHLYNWYDTRTLRPLRPAFVSTVDSGNFFASLLTVKNALLDWGEAELARRAEELLAAMDFRPLYDRERRLFYICYDTERERGAGGWYDLMASEAMLTSYLAIARGDVPVRHWRRLSRAQLQKDGYRGLASWTGTMFEYLMPALFLPLYRGSLLEETARFCLYVQKKRPGPGRPWGVSESAFYALDPALTYRYKANGCGALALKRGQDADLVISPYSSFLALAVDPVGAVRNLRLLERFGALGRFGFLEALDFSPGRCADSRGEKVRCTMAHHVGMSILAAANALCDGSVRRRFLAEPSMAACRLLLQERLPEEAPVLRRELSEVPEKQLRPREPRWRQAGPAGEERSCLLSNGASCLLADSRGGVRSAWRELLLYESACPATGFTAVQYRFTEEEARWEGGGMRLRLCAASGDPGERWELQGPGPLEFTFRPLLARERDVRDAPAYWRLGILAQEREDALLLRRLPRRDRPGCWLCLRGEGKVRFRFDPRRMQVCCESRGNSLRLALCPGDTAEEALAGAARILRSRERGNLVTAVALRLGTSAAEVGAAMALLPLFSRPLRHAAPRRALWPYGISGDFPLLCCEGRSPEALPLLRQWLLLKSCGAESELVVFSDEEGEYRRPVYQRFRKVLAELGLEALIGSRGGVHFAPRKAAEAILSRAAFAPGREPGPLLPLRFPVLGRPRQPGSVPAHRWEKDAFCFAVREDLPGRAWQQMLAGERLGAIVTEAGLAALWLENAREMPLLPAMTDLRGTEGPAALWAELPEGPVSLFAANDGRLCSVRYAPGLACFEKALGTRQVRTTVFLPPGSDALLLLIEGAEELHLRLALRPVLGPDASGLHCSFSGGVFRAVNPESSLPGTELLCLCSGFCGGETDFTPPALRLGFVAQPQSVLVLGCGEEEALRALCAPKAARRALAETRRRWASLLGPELPADSAAMGHYLNHWCAYQALACRLLGRSSLYQSGGAFGFRDQLQDAVNLLPLEPGLARERILDCCRHQYVEGDVMHWWHPHPEGDRGVRSRCADDLLWLSWALCEYTDFTGDRDFCLREEPFLSSPPLKPEEPDRYEQAGQSEASASLLFHARSALELCVTRGFGPHGLPRFLGGDWNDAMDAVDGESVWLGWFFVHCAERLSALLEALDKPGADYLRQAAARVRLGAESAWNGRFYRRGWWADGAVLGGDGRIDAITQAWAAFCGAAHADAALDEALRRLADPEQRPVRLFDPPYTEAERSPGSIVGYGPGIRENGGQYTHGAVWLALACLERGRREEARRILERLLPENADPARYEAEPFVLPADVSAAPGREGEAGWTWYTGSAGWYFRAARALLNRA